MTYQCEGADWGLTAGLGGSWEGKAEDEFVDPLVIKEQDFYQAGLNLSFGNFSIGIAGEYFHDISTSSTDDESAKTDSWSAGIGAAYAMDAWTFGAQYSHREINADVDFNGVDTDHFDITQDRVVLTAIYALGPGITVDGELGYTWLDTDPAEDIFFEGESADGYDAFEIGIGTTLTF